MEAKSRLFHNADRTKLLPEGHKDAAFLYAAPGDEIPEDAAKTYGLVDGDLPGQKPTAAEKKAAEKAEADRLATEKAEAEKAAAEKAEADKAAAEKAEADRLTTEKAEAEKEAAEKAEADKAAAEKAEGK